MAASVEIIITFVILCFFRLIPGSYSTSLKIVNNCGFTVWPAMLSNPGILPLPITGFILGAGEYAAVEVPPNWSGRIYGRTFCSHNSKGVFSCLTGDCGSSTLQCPGGIVAPPPATFVEFILNGGAGGLDQFEVSLVDGYNIPMIVEPKGGNGTGNCTATGPCVIDLNKLCPSELKVIMSDGEAVPVGCKSPCKAFGDPKSCCTETYATAETCKPSDYAINFKNGCPNARTYVYDQSSTSTFACLSANYVVAFCLSSPSLHTRETATPLNKESTPPAKKADSGGGFTNTLKDIAIIAVSIFTLTVIACKIVAFLRGRGTTVPVTVNINPNSLDGIL